MTQNARKAATSRWLAGVACAVTFAPAALAAEPKANPWPAVTSSVKKDPRMEARIAELLHKMTLEQKVAQMLQADIRSVTPEDVRTYRLGSILNGGGAFPANEKHSKVSDW